MKWAVAIASVLAVLGSAGSPITLTDVNFDHDTQIGGGMTTGSWFVKFYAPWCGHCQKMAPAWEALVDELAEEPINIAEVDATGSPGLATRFDIRGYPTLLYFNKNKMYKYRGPRDTASLATFVREGFKDAEEFGVPARLTWVGHLKRWLSGLMGDLQYIWRGRRAAGGFLIGFGLSLGVSVGFMVGSVLTARASLKGGRKTPTLKRKAN